MKVLRMIGVTCLLAGVSQAASAQADSSLTFSGYAEAYYHYDFNRPANHLSDGFFYNFNRHNEVNVNLALIKAAYQTDRVRGNIGLMAGTYAQYNLASEPELLRHVWEANAGVRLARNLWLDAGILPSHIGFESAVGKDNWALSRSLLAENSPYYEAGAKLSYSTGNWQFSALYLNGWQRIQRVAGNQTPAFGWQVQWKSGDRITLNSSSFIGNDKPDSTRQMRYFHNLYAILKLSDRWAVTAAFDIGIQQQAKGSSAYNTWYSPIVIVRYQWTDRLTLAGRAEYYQDKKGVIITSPAPFAVFGYSLNADYRFTDHVLARIEGRVLNSKEAVFQKEGGFASSSTSLNTSLCFSF